MSIFEKFQNTVFVKDSSELERKIKALTEIKDKVKEKEQIEKEIKQSIVKVDGLIDYLKKDIAKKSKDELNSKKEMENIAKKILLEINTLTNKNYIEKYTILEKEENKANISTNVESNKKTNDDTLRKRLINFRKEKSQNGIKKFPAYYVFTNEELEKLVSLKPKTIEELRKLKILSEVKIKCHGEEIIAIILKI